MDGIIERVAALIGNTHIGAWIGRDVDVAAAQALRDAGLLVTPEQRAVLDAAEAWRGGHDDMTWAKATNRLVDAVDALRAATPNGSAAETGTSPT